MRLAFGRTGARLFWLILALCLVVFVAGIGTSKADAYWGHNPVENHYRWFHGTNSTNYVISPAEFEQKAKRMAGHGVRYGATGQAIPFNQTANATQVQAMLDNLNSSSTQNRRVKAKALSAAQRLGTMPLLRTVGTMVLTFGAWEVGWKIGTTAATWLGLKGNLPVAPAPSYTAPHVEWNDSADPAQGVYEWPQPGEFWFMMAKNGVPQSAKFTNEDSFGESPCQLSGAYYPLAFANKLMNQSGGDAFTDGWQHRFAENRICNEPDGEGGSEGHQIEKGLMVISEGDLVDDPGVPVPFAGQPVTETTAKPLPVSEQDLLDRAKDIMQDPDHDPYTRALDENTDHDEDEDVAGPVLVPIPDCTGMSYNVCLEAIQNAGFGVIERQTLSFEEAIPYPVGEANQVQSTIPDAGVATDTYDTVTIVANPGEADMPFIMPDLRGMIGPEAADALAPFGWPAPNPSVLPESQPHQDYGPDKIARQQPDPGSRQPTGTPSSPPTVEVNPPTAPNPGGSGYTCGLSAPSPAFDLSPISSAQLDQKLPFSFATFLTTSLGGLALASEPPNAEFSVGPETFDMGFLATFEPEVTLFRNMLTFLLCIGAGWFTYGRTIGRDT
jgi:hypothetical protein